MFEMIGLIVGAASLLGASVVAGCVYALVALLLIGLKGGCKFWVLMAGLLPIASAIYIVVCSVAFSIVVPGQSGALFGDISEPLPNGYTLAALGKMPTFASIDPPPNFPRQPGLLGYVRSIQVEGGIVYGEYGSRFNENTWPDDANHGCFAFDTRSRVTRNFNTLAELNAFAGHPVHLVKAPDFRSHEESHKHFLWVKNAVLFWAPAIANALYLIFLLCIRISRKGVPTKPEPATDQAPFGAWIVKYERKS